MISCIDVGLKLFLLESLEKSKAISCLLLSFSLDSFTWFN